MAAVILAIEVEDYDLWRSRFESMADARKDAGIQSARVYQDVSDPNKVTVVIDGDLSDLQAYSQSPVLKEAMAEGGVLGPPNMSFVNEVT